MGSDGVGGHQFVGREQELADLRALIAGTDKGPRAAFIIGDPGIGKSRLLSEATSGPAEFALLSVVGFEPESSIPLGAASGMLRSLSGRGPAGARLSAILSGDAEEQSGIESLRVFEAAYRALASMSPVLIAVDDLQWLDELSRALLHYLLRAARDDGESLVLVCAGRPTPAVSAFSRSVRDLLGEPDRSLSLQLGPLSRADGTALARVVSPSLSDAAVEALWSRGRGSPFWILMGAHRAGHPYDPLENVFDVMRSVTMDGASCLTALAVAARPIFARTVAELLGWDLTRADSALAELVLHGLAAPAAGWFATAHDLVREAVMAQLPPGEEIRMHTRLASVLEREAGNDVQLLMEALGHAEAAGVSTVELGIAIARSPQRRLIGLAGLSRLDAIAQSPIADTTALLTFKTALAGLAAELSDHESACDRYAALCDLVPTAGERLVLAAKGATHALEAGRAGQARMLVERIRKDGTGNPWASVAADALEFRRRAWLDHDSKSARPYRERAVSEAHRLVAELGPAESLDHFARKAYLDTIDAERVARLMDDDILGMLQYSDEMVEASRGFGGLHLDARLASVMALRFLNRWQEVEERLWSTLEEARQSVYPGLVAYATYQLALTVYNLGRVAEARDLYTEAQQLGARVDASFEVMDTWLCGLGQLLDASAVDWHGSISSLMAEAEEQSNAHCRLMVNERAAMCAGWFSPDESADLVDRLLEAGRADAEAADCVRCRWELCLVSAELYARVGRLDRAEQLLADWDSAHPAPHARASYMRARTEAVVAAAASREDAASLLRMSIDSAAAAGLRLDEVRGLIDLGALLARRDPAGAIEAWTAGIRLAEELGAASEAGMLKRRLRELGVRRVSPVHRAGNTSLSSLTPREAEVARLAAQGARNAEIATTLFISPKTVEQHLSRAFARLGVRNRAELGARFGGQLLAGLVDTTK